MDWIAVGLSVDLPRGLVMPSCVHGTDLAVWRDMSGTCHAWGDRCPHRGMRLSHGFVRGERLACIYHGWQYGTSGECAHIPAHPALTPPKSICATTYACRETDGMVWVSLGNAETAPAAIGSYQPVRSLPVAASVDAIAAHVGHSAEDLITVQDGVEITVALQPVSETAAMMHVLCAPGQDRKRASQKAETLRTEVEARQS